MNGSYGVALAAFDKLFAMLPWLGAAVGLVVLLWIACCWREA